MSVNNSSSTNGSFPTQHCYNTLCIAGEQLFNVSIYIYIVFILPLCTFVLYLGFQQWKQQRPLEAVMSSCDFFTYNMAVMELIGIFGGIINIVVTHANLRLLKDVGNGIMAFPWSGQVFLPVLTCADRYMAVVHPITYLKLKQVTRIRIRNISTGYIWLQGIGAIVFMIMIKPYHQYGLIPGFSLLIFAIIAVISCSLPVLCVLIRPRPGEGGRKKLKVDQSKQRAFNTIIIIMGVLMFRFGGSVVCSLVTFLPTTNCSLRCFMINATQLFSLPSSLVLPLLFLHRTGKLPGCKHNTVPG